MIHLAGIGFLLVMTVAVAFFAGVETGLFSVARPKIRNLADKGDPRAAIIADFLERPDDFIGTALIGISLAHATVAVVAAWYFNLIFDSPALSALATACVLTPLLLLFGEILPKSIYRTSPHATTLASARFFRWVDGVFRPFTRVVVFISNALLPAHEQDLDVEASLRREEVLAMVREGEKTGVVDDVEKEMIEAALELPEKTVREVMKPRVAVAAVHHDQPLKEVVDYVVAQGYTRYPVYRDTPDHVIGILHTTDLLTADRLDMVKLLPPVYIPETAKVDDALERLRKEGRHQAVVVDEYGGTAGIVTIEDLLEEMVGEIEDEYDDSPTDVIAVAPNRWKMAGAVSLDDVAARTGLVVNREEIEAETLGGMITEKLGRIPKTGEVVPLDSYSALIIAADDRHVSAVELKKNS